MIPGDRVFRHREPRRLHRSFASIAGLNFVYSIAAAETLHSLLNHEASSREIAFEERPF
jgi:hypothetical protein